MEFSGQGLGQARCVQVSLPSSHEHVLHEYGSGMPSAPEGKMPSSVWQPAGGAPPTAGPGSMRAPPSLSDGSAGAPPSGSASSGAAPPCEELVPACDSSPGSCAVRPQPTASIKISSRCSLRGFAPIIAMPLDPRLVFLGADRIAIFETGERVDAVVTAPAPDAL